MARVEIGVPVYNGASMLAESLECLRAQTFEDFRVVIGDNASDDATAEIAADFAARDGRFHHLRRKMNVGSLANFQGLRAASRAELFCWRAYDDLSAPDYLERLVALFDADPNTRLAVPEVRSAVDDKAKTRVTRYSAAPQSPRIRRIRHQMFASHASWIYGLWHRETLAGLQDRGSSRLSPCMGLGSLDLPACHPGRGGAGHKRHLFRAAHHPGNLDAGRAARQAARHR